MKKIITNMSEMKARRLELCLTQKEVAEKIGVSLKTYADWENSKRKPLHMYFYNDLATVLNCEFDINGAVFTGENTESESKEKLEKEVSVRADLEKQLKTIKNNIATLQTAEYILRRMLAFIDEIEKMEGGE